MNAGMEHHRGRLLWCPPSHIRLGQLETGIAVCDTLLLHQAEAPLLFSTTRYLRKPYLMICGGVEQDDHEFGRLAFDSGTETSLRKIDETFPLYNGRLDLQGERTYHA